MSAMQKEFRDETVKVRQLVRGREFIGPARLRVLLAVTQKPGIKIQELRKKLGLSAAGTQNHLVKLLEAGLVSWERNLAGTLRANVRLEVMSGPI